MLNIPNSWNLIPRIVLLRSLLPDFVQKSVCTPERALVSPVKLNMPQPQSTFVAIELNKIFWRCKKSNGQVFDRTLYLYNQSSNLYEIWNFSSLDINWPTNIFLWRSVFKTRTRGEIAHTHNKFLHSFLPTLPVCVNKNLFIG